MIGWLSAEDARTIAATIAAVCGAIIAMVAVGRLPWVSVPARWLGRTLIGQPLARFIHEVLDSWWSGSPQAGRLQRIEEQVFPNGGSSLRDVADRTARAVGAEPVID